MCPTGNPEQLFHRLSRVRVFGARPASIRRRQPPHREFDAVVVELAPELDLGRIGGLGIAIEPLARFLARFGARQA